MGNHLGGDGGLFAFARPSMGKDRSVTRPAAGKPHIRLRCQVIAGQMSWAAICEYPEHMGNPRSISSGGWSSAAMALRVLTAEAIRRAPR